MEGQQSLSNKGPTEENSNSAASPLTVQGDQSEKPGETYPINHPYLPSSGLISAQPQPRVPQPQPRVPQPGGLNSFIPVIQPLSSSLLVSPPPSLPLIQLPDYPALSPIEGRPFQYFSSPEQLAPINEEINVFKLNYERSHIQDWARNLSPIGEPEWDNYFRTPPTYSNYQEFWESRTDRASRTRVFSSPLSVSHPGENKIELVDTVSSAFSSKTEVVSSSHTIGLKMPEEKLDATGVNFNDLQVSFKQRRDRLLFKINDFGEDDVDSSNIQHIEGLLKEIRDEHVELSVDIKNFLVEYKSEVGDHLQFWENCISDQSQKVKAHARKIRAKVDQLSPQRVLTDFEKEMLAAQKATAEAQKQLVELETKRQERQNVESKALVSSKAVEIKDKVKALETHIKLVETRDDPEFWSNTSAETITRAMKNLKLWDSSLQSIEDVYREFERLVKIHGEPENAVETGYNLDGIKSLLKDLKIDFKDAKDSVIKEDKDRALFSLEQAKAETLKYPSFSGEPGQDLFNFKEKMEYRFKRNQVAKQDQIEKLRENLKGQALRLVPETTKDIDVAWSILKDAFGDAARVLQHRLDILHDMGDLPPETTDRGQPNFGKRVEFLLKLENIIRDIIELGQGDDEDLMYLAFNSKIVGVIVNKFPNNLILKLTKVGGKGQQRLINIKDKIIEFRGEAQELEKTKSLYNPSNSVKARKEPRKSNSFDSPSKVQISYSPPKTDPNCRVCKHLKEVENFRPAQNTAFFEGHLSSYITGCPQFIQLDMAAKYKIVSDIKLCNRCFHPDVVYSRDHIKDCSVSTKKNVFSCTVCKMHSWICKYHKTENQSKLDKFKRDYREKHKLKLVFFANLSVDSPVLVPTSQPEVTDSTNGDTVVHESIQINSEPINRSPELSLAAATKLIKKRLRSNGFKGDIKPVPEGEPLFLFFRAKGRENGANTFFDNGCSTAVFREGIPGKELRGKITKKGPFVMTGVGDIRTKANDQWLCVMDTVDGGKQFVEGLTVDKVTADFPVINLETAVNEVRQDGASNEFLQSCKIPSSAGGSTDVLLGITYASIHPVLVHQLPSGLAIYKSALASHGNKYTCLIGGPHRSFDVCAGHAGGVSRLLVQFVEGIQIYRKWGPPMITDAPMSVEEETYAIRKNVCEGDIEAFAAVSKFSELEEYLDDELPETELNQNGASLTELCTGADQCACSNMPFCCANLSAMLLDVGELEVSSSEKLRHLKQLILAQEGGVSEDYRCTKCRDCWDCKNADSTEKLSLREEQENQLIKESVKLNFATNSIECTLPVRGSEREFLTSNKDLASKVLNSVTTRYQNDENAKLLMIASFKKLFDKGYLKLISQLSPEEKGQFESKEIQYFIPWRPVFADSASTPCRIVMDASSRTQKRADGTGGRCLNDFVVKGTINNMNLIRLVLRWSVGQFALSGDIAQFYNTCKLDPKQWNLQRFLWRDGLNSTAPIQEGVITTLMYGVKCVAAQSGYALEQLAEVVKETDPELYIFLKLCLYVDDLANSKKSLNSCINLSKRADELFATVNLHCKGWTFTGHDPAEKVTKDGISIGVAGLKWIPKVDSVQVKIPALHFGSRRRGKLDENTTFFTGEFADLDKFVPKNLSRRITASKLASIFDIGGKLVPILIGMKSDLREVVRTTSSWDEAMSCDLRNRWVTNFWRLEKLRGINFHRAVMPENAIDTKMRLITGVDSALEAMILGCWGGFKLTDGSWSCKLVIGRGLLAPVEGTIPKNELESLTGGSNLSWVVRKALEDWISSSIVVGDSQIALCWVIGEHRKLSMYHRNRVIQIRRGTELDQLYHVISNQNPADVGTRPCKVSIDDVGPNSRWENGQDWMHGEIEEAVQQGILKPAADIKVTKEIEDEYYKGLLYESPIPEIITKGHAVNTSRIALIQERSEFSNYILLPTKYSFRKTVRTYSIVMAFISKVRKNKGFSGPLLKEADLKFSAFTCSSPGKNSYNLCLTDQHADLKSTVNLLTLFSSDCNLDKKNVFIATQTDRRLQPIETDKFIDMSLRYLFRKATGEVKEFNSASFIQKHMIEKDGILLSKTRLTDQLDYMYTSELSINLGSLGIKFEAPCLDRFSPLSYAFAQFVHWDLAPHRGIETHNRISLEYVYIVQGMSLYRELSQECIRCNMRRKKFLEVKMGGIKPEQLIIAPPFWACQLDLFGPYKVYVPGYERETRNRPLLDAQVWIMAIVCPTTRLVNLQVIEKTDVGGIICGITRLACESGLPKYVFTDQDSAIMSALSNAEVTLRDLEHQVYKEHQIIFTVCPVGGHSQHGQVERVIRSIQQGLNDCGLKNERLHATGVQSLCKLVENTYNSLPIGYSYDRDQDNTRLLKIICPNMLKMGHKNQRQLEGPIRLARGTRELLEKVESLYYSWFTIWRDTVVPKIMFQPKWYNSDKDLKEEDLVYFQKKEGKVDQPWTIGRVEQVMKSDRDGLIRRVIVRYQNPGESQPQFTDRSVRKLVKLFNVDEHQVQEDLDELQKKIDAAQPPLIDRSLIDQSTPPFDNPNLDDRDCVDAASRDNVPNNTIELQEADPEIISQVDPDDIPARNTRSRRRCNCCCELHCSLSLHTMGRDRAVRSLGELPVTFELGWIEEEQYVEDFPGVVGLPLDEESASFAGVLQSLQLSL